MEQISLNELSSVSLLTSVAASRLCLVSSLHLVGAFEVFQISLSLVHSSLKFFDPDECVSTPSWGGFAGAPGSEPCSLLHGPPGTGKCWDIRLEVGPGKHRGRAQGPLPPGRCLLTALLCPVLPGTSSTSSWTPPWACCSSTWGCVPSASWWSGSSGSPCGLANMVMQRGHWTGCGGGFLGGSAPCPSQLSRPVDLKVQDVVALSSVWW